MKPSRARAAPSTRLRPHVTHGATERVAERPLRIPARDKAQRSSLDPSRGCSLTLLRACSDVALGPRLRAIEEVLPREVRVLQELDVADDLALLVRLVDELADLLIVQVERVVRR